MAASKSSSSTSAGRSESCAGQQITTGQERNLSEDAISIIESLKQQVAAERFICIKKKMEDNMQKLCSITQHVHSMSKLRRNSTVGSTSMVSDLLTGRQEEVICSLNGEPCSIERDGNSCHDESSFGTSTVLFTSNNVGKNAILPIKLPEVQQLPPYTTWIFLDRNQRMTEDQSVVGRRRIYYDQNCGEALICSDSEEEIMDDEEEKKEFRSIEDNILRMTIHEAGISDVVMDSLSQHLERNHSDIKARYEHLLKQDTAGQCSKIGARSTEDKADDALLEKDLDAALDSFDNLFCRRCLVFDCRLHGCSQDLVFPVEKPHSWSNPEETTPCGCHCYKLASSSENIYLENSHALAASTQSFDNEHSLQSHKKKVHASLGNAKLISESSESKVRPRHGSACSDASLSLLKLKTSEKLAIRKRKSKTMAERVLICMRKRQKKMAPAGSAASTASIWPRDMKLKPKAGKSSKGICSVQRKKLNSQFNRKYMKPALLENSNVEGSRKPSEMEMPVDTLALDGGSSREDEFVGGSIYKHESNITVTWKSMEKSLFSKGLDIFGRNSCLIARNLLNGMRTCMEVFQYMNFIEKNGAYDSGDNVNMLAEGHGKSNELRTRSRFVRRRGKVRRLKYTWKSAGYHSIRKRITERKDQPCRQYNPCGCQSACGKQCPCPINGTCCEKYCGCPKICKNRFRGCHCAKSQCRSRQCPCFAADRECDPDVCRNCWVGCGDGTLGGPSQRGDNYECRNMKLLLKQQQRVLLGRSDVSGWGAFIKNSVGKREYLGEYTGELISHREADKRGKIYDRENSSFLFNLNDQFVLDAYRKGDKLKFANHSPEPNCYAKVIMVAGDHRVGIFAKERISAGEELFYDYRYEPDQAPAWARKPEASGSKKDEPFPSSGRAKKLA